MPKPRDPARARLTVGSWPGESFATNDYVRVFCQALVDAGCSVFDVSDPRRLRRGIDVLHIHWPEQVFWKGGSRKRMILRSVTTLLALARLRLRGVTLVWMVHNARPHDLAGFRARLWPMIGGVLPRLVHAYMTLSPATVPIVTATYPALARKPFAVARQPAYPPVAAPGLPDMRAAAGVPPGGRLLAMIGFLRPYKGAEELIAAFKAAEDPDGRLLIAGKASAAYAQRLAVLAEGDGRITILPGLLSDDALAAATLAADWMVLPLRTYLHSGSMIHALSMGRPVLTPRQPFAEELARTVGEDWVRLYDGPLTASALQSLRVPAGRPDLTAFAAPSMGRAVRAFYENVRSATRRRTGAAR